jgi:LPS sulfotransferase NodH
LTLVGRAFLYRKERSMKKFAIFSVQRTGSTLLCQQLGANPSCICHYELFNATHIGFGGKHYTGLTPMDVQERDKDIEAFYDTIFEPQENIDAIGFKIFQNHHPQALVHALRDKSLVKILLKRDMLTTYTSLQQALAAKFWLSTDENETNKHVYLQKVHINIEQFEHYCGTMSYFYNFVEQFCRATGQDYLSLYYHNVKTGDKLEYLMEKLTISSNMDPKKITVKKQGKPTLKERIANYGELVEYCAKYHKNSLILAEAAGGE